MNDKITKYLIIYDKFVNKYFIGWRIKSLYSVTDEKIKGFLFLLINAFPARQGGGMGWGKRPTLRFYCYTDVKLHIQLQ